MKVLSISLRRAGQANKPRGSGRTGRDAPEGDKVSSEVFRGELGESLRPLSEVAS